MKKIMSEKTKKVVKKTTTKKNTTKKKDKSIVKKALTLTQAPIAEKQLLFILQKTPAKHIYTRKAKGGGTWNYVTGVYVKKALNYAFGWMWDFEIKDKGKEGDLVWVQGRLTIRNKKGEAMIVKEQFGRADIKYKRGTKDCLDYGNDLKAASTDALKKCASELGIASDVYGKAEFQSIQKEDKGFTPPKIENTPGEEEIIDEGETFKMKVPSKKVHELMNHLKGNTAEEKLADLKKRSGIVMNGFDITDKHATLVLAQLLNMESK